MSNRPAGALRRNTVIVASLGAMLYQAFTVNVADQTVVCAVAVPEWSSRAAISKRAKNRIGKRKLAAPARLADDF